MSCDITFVIYLQGHLRAVIRSNAPYCLSAERWYDGSYLCSGRFDSCDRHLRLRCSADVFGD